MTEPQEPTLTLSRGTYSPPTPTDIRGPCPMLNALANHGYIPRDGRNILAGEITSALHDAIGISTFVTTMFTLPIFFVHQDSPQPSDSLPSLWKSALNYLKHPTLIFRQWGMRRPNQTHPATGKRCLNLDQLGMKGVIEHDISLTRRDRAQGDCISPQRDLIEALLACRADGDNENNDGRQNDAENLSIRDLAEYRRRRVAAQKEENPEAVYGRLQHSFACMEIALLVGTFGDDDEVRKDLVRVFLQEERLPFREGWDWRRRKAGWWGGRRLGILRLGRLSKLVRVNFDRMSR